MYIFTEDKYIEFYFTLEDCITLRIEHQKAEYWNEKNCGWGWGWKGCYFKQGISMFQRTIIWN